MPQPHYVRLLGSTGRVYVGVFVRVGADDARVPIFTVIDPTYTDFRHASTRAYNCTRYSTSQTQSRPPCMSYQYHNSCQGAKCE